MYVQLEFMDLIKPTQNLFWENNKVQHTSFLSTDLLLSIFSLLLEVVILGFFFNGERTISDLFSSLVIFFIFVLGTLIPFFI